MKEYREQPWLSPKVEIRVSPIHGKAMFAKQPIREDEVVAIWGGRYVTEHEADEAHKTGLVVQKIEDDVFEVYELRDKDLDPTQFMNHSCDPNVWMLDEVTLAARRGIREGEELTGDYAMWEAEEEEVKPWICRCGSANCRKTITGRDWRRRDLQEQYGNHFSPFINRRIAAMRN